MDYKKVSFGFKKVAEELKENLVNQVFSSVSGKYDLMNDLMSLGIHRVWKHKLIQEINLKENLKVIDMAGGTGDIALKLYRKLLSHDYKKFNITIADFNREMLQAGQDRAINKNIIDNRISWQEDNGEASKFSDAEFDLYTIAYGIRNFTDITKGLQEAYRILDTGGEFFCLEFSAVPDNLLGKLYDFYSFNIIPRIGELVTQDRESYQYFVESIRTFPAPEDFSHMMKQVGFRQVTHVNLTGGITTLYKAVK